DFGVGAVRHPATAMVGLVLRVGKRVPETSRKRGAWAVRRKNVDADRPWARTLGYSRAVRVGNVIEVSGTAAAGPDGEILSPGDRVRRSREPGRDRGDGDRRKLTGTTRVGGNGRGPRRASGSRRVSVDQRGPDAESQPTIANRAVGA